MIDLEKHRLLKYPLFGSLYFSQGIIYALAIVIIPVYFIEKGISIEITTIVVGIAYVPWITKFIFGGIADYFIHFGRKKFIFVGGILSSICFFLLSFIDPKTALLPFTFVIFLVSMGIAFFDVSADAWAIQLSTEKERGKINAAMFAGLFIGMAITTSVIANIANVFGYESVFITSSLIVLAIMILTMNVKEEIIVRERQKIGKTLVKEFKKKSTQIVALFGPISAISFGILGILLPIYMKTILELDIGKIGLIMTIGPIATVIGNIFGGFLTDIWGRKKPLYIFIGLNLIFASMLIFANDWQKIAILWGIIGFLHGGHYSIIGALMMDVTNPKIGAAQYSILTSLANAGEMGGTAMTGSLITLIGFSRVFLYSAWIYGPTLLILYFIRLKTNKKQT